MINTEINQSNYSSAIYSASNASSGKRTRVISITSGKGGVGKTTTSINLGLALTQLNHKVLILDADLGLANVDIMLGFRPSATIDDLIQGNAKVQDIIVSHPSGLDVIPSGSGVYEVTNLEDEDKRRLIDSLEELNGIYDYLIIDTGAGIGNNVLYFNSASERVLVVVDPEPTSITDAYALIKLLAAKKQVDQFEVIINRAPKGSDGRDIFRKLSQATQRFLNVKMNLLGVIQEDSCAHEAIIKQTPLFQLYPSTRASRDILRLAKSLENLPLTSVSHGGLKFFFESLLA
jgi:flagellar biosynthesis protein FlhG